MLDLSPLWISLRIAAIATAITVVLGIAAAHWMQGYRGRWRSLLEGLFLAPMVLPPTVLGFLLLLLLGKNGPLGSLLASFGISVVFTWYAAILTATVAAFPLMYKTVLGALEQIDPNLQQAARTLGASELQLLWRITLPLAAPGIIAGTVLAFARALGEFGATLMLAGNIPGKTQTISMAIYFAVEAGDFREAAAWSGIMLAIALAGLLLVNGWQRPLPTVGAGLQRPSSRPSRPGASRATPSQRPSPSLDVTLYKQLPGFTLDVAFSTSSPSLGQPLGLLGASGAGKSLLLRCLAGIETPDAGRIVLNGRVLFDAEQGINVPSCDRHISILFQNYALFPHLTVAQNIAFGLSGRSPRQQRQVVEQELLAVQLEAMGDRFPAELSGGQQQRVALARALASQPQVLLLDEPFSALDTHLRYQIERDLRLRLEQFPGITLLVTHNIEEAYRICQTLLVLDQGKTSIYGSKSSVLEHPATVSAARLTGCKNVSRAVPVAADQVHALDWNCILQVAAPIPQSITHIGMRAHQFGFLETVSDAAIEARRKAADDPYPNTTSKPDDGEATAPLSIPNSPQPTTLAESSSWPSNTVPCWLTMTSETPHRMTLYLKLHQSPTHPQDYHLQAEVFKAKWSVLQDMSQPWAIVLDPAHLMLLTAAEMD